MASTRRVALVLGVLALLAACGSSGHKPHAAPRTTGQDFVRWLGRRHPGFHGPSFCQYTRNQGVQCFAEIHKGVHYVQVWAFAGAVPSIPNRFSHVSTGSWTRRWSHYMPPPQHVSPGVISANANKGLFDWRWLVLGVDALCRQKHRESCRASALDGQYGGYPGFDRFYDFACHARGQLYACRNKLGDAIRWRPSGASP